MGLYSPFLMANQGSNGGGGPFSSLGGLGCKKIALLCQWLFTPGRAGKQHAQRNLGIYQPGICRRDPGLLSHTTALQREAHGCAFALDSAGVLSNCTSLGGSGGGEGSASLTGGFCL